MSLPNANNVPKALFSGIIPFSAPQFAELATPVVPAQISASLVQSQQLGPWQAHWTDSSKMLQWTLGSPKFKYCKKRKDSYSEEIAEIWYKSPYKYHMLLDVQGMTETDSVIASMDLMYEDGQSVVYSKTQTTGKKSKKLASQPVTSHPLVTGAVTNNENYFVHSVATRAKSEVTIGPFQFNMCSYKQDGRKFRLVIYLYTPSVAPTGNQVNVFCALVSSAFTIRAKKPIVSPGIKKNKVDNKKRKSIDDDDSDDEVAPASKKQRTPPLVQAPPAAVATVVPAPNTWDNFIQQLDALTPASPLSYVNNLKSEKTPASADKVQNMASIFYSLDEKDRLSVLNFLLEGALPHEREFIRRKFFDDSMYASFPAFVQAVPYVPQVSTSFYTTQAMPAPPAPANNQQNDVDHFFTELM